MKNIIKFYKKHPELFWQNILISVVALRYRTSGFVSGIRFVDEIPENHIFQTKSIVINPKDKTKFQILCDFALFRLVAALLLFISILFSFAAKAQNEKAFEKYLFISESADTLPYRLMRPIVNDSEKKYPLILFLHGAGERGRNNTSQLGNSVLSWSSDSFRIINPCYVLCPQCAPGYRWVEVDWKLPGHVQPEKPSAYLSRTMLLLDSLAKNLNIDTCRIYITGLSMGGFGTWDAISRWHSGFAAAVPVCGGGDTAKAALIKDIPVWAFHGSDDKVVMTSRSRDMINAIRKAGGNPEYTEYPGTGHNAWDKTYSNPEMFRWLFSQSKAKRIK